jgi:acyl-coenzyme A synthetase/AMP-(fatty) acid ligase
VFSPIFAGSSVICCPSFDPGIFWSLLHNHSFTWYYAAPTMHQLILQTGRDDNYIDKKTGTCPYSLRMIANAAGGLLPSLANDMMKTFGANVSLVVLFCVDDLFLILRIKNLYIYACSLNCSAALVGIVTI